MAISTSEFNYRSGQLQELDFQDATPRLAGFLEWLDRDSKGAAILQELRNRDIQPLLDAAGYQKPPKPKTPEDVAAIAVCIIDSAAERDTEIFQIGFSIGVQAPSSKIQDTMDEISRRYIRPFFEYLEVRLFDSAGDVVPAEVVKTEKMNTTDVFIVHGRDEGPKQTVARFLERLGLNAMILHEQSNRGRTVIEKFEDHAEVQFAIVILTPDDIGRLATDPETSGRLRARQNVIFEMGYFIGRIGRERVFPLRVGEVDIPSDYAGVVYTEMDSRGAWKGELVRELKSAGFDIDANKAFE
jgi:predicted nucleotide-binding protein